MLDTIRIHAFLWLAIHLLGCKQLALTKHPTDEDKIAGIFFGSEERFVNQYIEQTKFT